MPLPYTEKDKEAFLRSYTDVYKAFGMTDDQINKFIERRVKEKDLTEEEKKYINSSGILAKYDAISKGNGKYSSFLYKNGGEFERIIKAMGKPETTIENIEYNNALARKLQSRDGIVEILQEAITMLATADKKIFSEHEENVDKLMEQYNIRNLGFVARALSNALASYRASLQITKEEIPEEIEKALEKNVPNYEAAQVEQSNMAADCDVLNLIMPPIEELIPVKFDKDPVIAAKQRSEREDKIADGILKVTHLPGRDKAFQQHFPEFMAKSNTRAMAGEVKFTEQSDAEKEFYKKIKNRMKEERKDYKAVAEKAKAKITDEFLLDIYALQSVIGQSNSKIINASPKDIPRLKAILAGNQVLIDENLKSVKKDIIASYHKPLKDTVEDMYLAVKGGNITGHRNPNYEKMLSSVEKMRKLVESGELKEKDREEYYKSLKELSNASNEYLKIKHMDDKLYSDRALGRISAATLCLGICRGFEAEKIIEDNNAAMKELNPAVGITGKLAKKDLSEMFDKVSKKHFENPTAQTFATLWSIDYAETQMEKQGLVLYGSDLCQTIEDNKNTFEKLANDSNTYKSAMERKDYIAGKGAFEKATRDRSIVQQMANELKKDNPQFKDFNILQPHV